MDILNYLGRLGYTTLPASFYRSIKLWEGWYKGLVASVHKYKVYNGKTSISRTRLSLQMAKKVSEDIADLLLNEKTAITISEGTESSKTSDYVHAVLDNNNFATKGNEYQERKAFSGTTAYVCQIVDALADENGFLSGGRIEINYVSAKNIFPLSWKNGSIIDCAFLFSKTIKCKKYAHIQVHELKVVDGVKQYVITNHIVECTYGTGREIPPEQWGEFVEFDDLQPVFFTGSEKPQFVIDRLNIVNNADEDDTNPMGIAIFANSMDVLKKIDLEYDSYANEFELGKKRIFVAPELLKDIDGNMAFDSNDTVFYQMSEEMMHDAPVKMKEVDMTLRTEEHEKAINGDLNLLSFKVGFGTERYKFEKGTIQTATQVISENSDMYRTIKKHELILNQVLSDLVRIIIRLGNVCGEGLNEEVDIKIDFDDSIIEDKSAERNNDRTDVGMGVMSLAEYRAKWYNETLEDATKNLPPQTEAVIA